jgi:glycerol-3-phosphate dehydrogenase
MAERVVDVLVKRMNLEKGRSLSPCQTKSIPLAGGAFAQSGEVERFRQKISRTVERLGLPSYFAAYLVFNYGKQAEEILADITHTQQPDNQELSLVLAELRFTLMYEGVCTADDFFNRRTGRLYFNLPSVLKYKEQVLQAMQKELNWDKERYEREEKELEAAISLVTTFPQEVEKTAEQVSGA